MNKWRQYREIERGEFFIVAGDCSQGGADYNACQFLSKTHIDFPLVYHTRGVAAQMTSDIFPVLEKIFDITGIQPVVAFEQNNGGISEMERLATLNRLGKYRVYVMKHIGKTDDSGNTGKYGFNTNTATRPVILGDWKTAVDDKVPTIYDRATIKEHFSFIINEQGKPEAEKTAHDDLIFAGGIAWQLFQTESAPSISNLPRPQYQPKDSVIGI